MKIALVILHADAARGGAERYTLDLAEALVKRGHDVSILASSFQSQPTTGKQILIDVLAKTRSGRYTEFIESLGFELNGMHFDVVHAMLPVGEWQCDVYHPHAGIASDVVGSGHLNKSGWINRGIAWIGNRTNLRRRRFATVEKRLLNSDDPPVVLCLSNLIKGVVQREYPNLPAHNLVPLFNGINLAKFDPAIHRESRDHVRDRFSITHDEVVGLMLAQDFERKGLRQAIEALAKVPGLILLVGGKPDPSSYRQLAKSLKVDDRVIFAGPVSDPVAFYQAADFFVLPTRFDPCSLVVLEALAMGLPVISTVKNGACEIMQDGVHGRVVADPDDIKALSHAFGEVADPAIRAGMSASCLTLRPALSQESHVDRLIAVYEHVLSSRRA